MSFSSVSEMHLLYSLPLFLTVLDISHLPFSLDPIFHISLSCSLINRDRDTDDTDYANKPPCFSSGRRALQEIGVEHRGRLVIYIYVLTFLLQALDEHHLRSHSVSQGALFPCLGNGFHNLLL